MVALVSDLSPSAFQLLNAWQHGFPLESRPFRKLGLLLGLSEQAVMDYLQRWQTQGIISRIGPVLNPACMSSTLVGMHVPPKDLDKAADWISALPAVNHNYEREHAINLWFVLTCASEQERQATLDHIAEHTGLLPMSLPMIRAYHIDLGFSLAAHPKITSPLSPGNGLPALGNAERKLLECSLPGLAIQAEPFKPWAEHAQMSEKQVLQHLRSFLEQGVFRRFGLVLRHRKLGYSANAMCVWTVDKHHIDTVGEELAKQDGITLCYQRQPYQPHWNHNLFCMIHGKDRQHVLAHHAELNSRFGLNPFPQEVLFSTRCFKQRGALLRPAHHD
ncbi:siroheme decarboxylase subunit beta [Alcaligenes faecalis]|uniref:siroheme decarboxylase subunit beta n=1 Tax=Alcaligenes faecalis TaxID=511 RepID=UPI0020A4D528|nr:Lrp/AsnC family transcriptional regulator [Alcaligenes faecalis]